MKEVLRTSLHMHMGQGCGVLLQRGHTPLSGDRRSSECCSEGVGNKTAWLGYKQDVERSVSCEASPCHLRQDLVPKKWVIFNLCLGYGLLQSLKHGALSQEQQDTVKC